MPGVAVCSSSNWLATLLQPLFLLFAGLVAALAIAGCHHEQKTPHKSVAEPPSVQLIQPQARKIVRVVGQPSFIQSYERSSVYPKMNAYIQKWIVDIGDKVKKNDVLATLFVPELVEDHGTKKATVVLDRERVALAKVMVEVAKANVEAAAARLEEARAELADYEAEAERWDSETKRLQHEVDRGVVSPQTLLQTTDRWKASIAARQAARATVSKATDELLARRAARSQAEVDVGVAESELKVAESEEKRLKVWVDYLVLPAPYDGVIVAATPIPSTLSFLARAIPRHSSMVRTCRPPELPHRSTWSTVPTSSVSSSTSPRNMPNTSRLGRGPRC